MGIWYRAGTVAVTNGSAVVTGMLTTFSVYVRPGDALRVGSDNRRYEVLSVDSNTQITLASNYAGTTASGAAYEIETTSYRHQIPSDILERLREVLEGQTDVFTTTGTPSDAIGAEGSIAFDGAAKLLYRKGASTWVVVTSFGANGWSPQFAVASDGARRVLQVTGWTGGSGTPPATGSYVGSTGLVSAIGDAIDFRGPIGVTGNAGTNGWSPQLALVSDGARRVLQVSGWAGGTGSPPASGSYIGATGLVSAIGDALDIRGPAGVGSSTNWGDIGGTLSAQSDLAAALNGKASVASVANIADPVAMAIVFGA